MLNANLIRDDAAGRLLTTGVGTVSFNGGTPAGDLGDLQVATSAAGAAFHAGLLYDPSMRLVVDAASAIAGYSQGGLPVTAAGALCTESLGVPVTFNAGVAISASGRVCVSP